MFLSTIFAFFGTAHATQQVFYGRFISTPQPDRLLIQSGAVLVNDTDGTGVITKTAWNVTDLEKALSQLDASKDVLVVRASEEGFFFPGFIDTHIHAPQYPNSGLFAGTLLNWLKAYSYPTEASLGNPNSPAWANTTASARNPLGRARLVYTQVIERTLSYGTTTASYFATNDLNATNLLASLAFEKGQRAFIGRVCMDNHDTLPDYYVDATPEQAMNDTISSVNYIRKLDPNFELVAPIITPRFANAVTPGTLQNLGDYARTNNLRIQTHLAENIDEVAQVLKLFPNISSYTGVYDAYGLLTDRTTLAHAVHLSDAEMQLIKDKGAGVSHCPVSNSALGSGFCQVRNLIQRGIPVSLGTDVAGGYSSSILEQVRHAYLVSRNLEYLDKGNRTLDVEVPEGLYLATMGGAKILGKVGLLGGFDVGMSWDVQEIQLNDVQKDGMGVEGVDIFGWESWDERVLKWVWTGDERNVKRVWVGGRLVHKS